MELLAYIVLSAALGVMATRVCWSVYEFLKVDDSIDDLPGAFDLPMPKTSAAMAMLTQQEILEQQLQAALQTKAKAPKFNKVYVSLPTQVDAFNKGPISASPPFKTIIIESPPDKSGWKVTWDDGERFISWEEMIAAPASDVQVPDCPEGLTWRRLREAISSASKPDPGDRDQLPAMIDAMFVTADGEVFHHKVCDIVRPNRVTDDDGRTFVRVSNDETPTYEEEAS